MTKIRIREISDKANDVNRERAEIYNRRQQASRVAANAQSKMGEIQRSLDSLSDDATETERSHLLLQYRDCVAEYRSAIEVGKECDIRSERLNEAAREVIALAEDYLESANNQVRQAYEAQAKSSYGKSAIGALAASIKSNANRARQIISLLGGNASLSEVPDGSSAEEANSFFSDYKNLVQEAAFGTVDGAEGSPSLADRQNMVSFVNASYAQGVVALAQSTPEVDQSSGTKLLAALQEAYSQTDADSLWDSMATTTTCQGAAESGKKDSGDTIIVFEEVESAPAHEGNYQLQDIIDRDRFASTIYTLAEGQNETSMQRVFRRNGNGTASIATAVDIGIRYNQVCDFANARITHYASILASPNVTDQQAEACRQEISYTRQILAETTDWLLREAGAEFTAYSNPDSAPVDFRNPLPDSAFKEALMSNDSEEFSRRIAFLPSTEQSWTTIGNGNRLYNTPEETGASLNWHQGIAFSNIQGDCGLVCCENVARLAGKNVSEADVISFARDNFLCTVGMKDAGSNGGTFAYDRQIVLSSMGIDSYLDTNLTPQHVADLVETGHGVIASVDVSRFWREYAYDNAGGHAVTLLSVERNSEGSPVAFYVCDSGIRDRSRRVDSNTFLQSLIADTPLNVTTGIIR